MIYFGHKNRLMIECELFGTERDGIWWLLSESFVRLTEWIIYIIIVDQVG